MIDKIYVFDDIIPKEEQDHIEKELLGRHFGWFYLKDISHIDNPEQARPGFSHYFVTKGQPNSDKVRLLDNIVTNACKKINFKVEGVTMARSFLQVPLSERLLNEKPDTPHVDSEEDHIVVLYYVTDSDGDTILYENKFEKDVEIKWDILKEKQKVSPKKGRVLIFNGRHYHTACQPTRGTRTIINCNVI